MNQLSWSFKKHFSVEPILASDAVRQTDRLRQFRSIVLTNEPMYPGIDHWFDRKVVPGIASSERVAFIGCQDGIPCATAIVKRGARSKFCHLKVSDDLQGNHVGELFFALMAVAVRPFASEVHFTLPEGLWSRQGEFFRSFGFTERCDAGTQYRLFENELHCAAPFHSVWKSVIDKLPKLVATFTAGGYSLNNSILMSVRPRWADMLLSGRKSVEVRRVFSRDWVGKNVSIYASDPVKGIVGEARIEDVVAGQPSQIWDQFERGIGCRRDEFDSYAQGAKRVFAVKIADVRPFRHIVPLVEMRGMVGETLRPPQSYSALTSGSAWGKASSIASLINASQ